MACGVYKIQNLINKQIYIGISANILVRWRHHETASLRTTDPEYNKTLYRAFRKYGLNNFSFEVIELCPKAQLAEREIYWIEQFDSYNNGYNETIGGELQGCGGGEDHFNHVLTEADVKNIRTRYARLERRRDVYKDYQNKISKHGFNKVWKGENWKDIMMNVYTKENINAHKQEASQPGSENARARLTEQDVINIRLRRKNGEPRAEVYKDYKDKVTFGSFTNTWYGNNWQNIIV